MMSRTESRKDSVPAILVPIDFEPPARAALVFAARLATSTGVPLKILHVVHEPADRPNYYRRDEQDVSLPIEILADRMLREFLADVRGENPALDILENPYVVVAKGLPLSRILEFTKHHPVAQIVMGHARARGMLPGLFSSLSDRVADKCGVPVTAIHAGDKSRVVDVPPGQLLDADSNAVLGT